MAATARTAGVESPGAAAWARAAGLAIEVERAAVAEATAAAAATVEAAVAPAVGQVGRVGTVATVAQPVVAALWVAMA